MGLCESYKVETVMVEDFETYRRSERRINREFWLQNLIQILQWLWVEGRVQILARSPRV